MCVCVSVLVMHVMGRGFAVSIVTFTVATVYIQNVHCLCAVCTHFLCM